MPYIPTELIYLLVAIAVGVFVVVTLASLK